MVNRRDLKHAAVLDLNHGSAAVRQNARAFIHDLLDSLALRKRYDLGTDRDGFTKEQRRLRAGEEQLHRKILIKIRRERNGCQSITVIEAPAVKLRQR